MADRWQLWHYNKQRWFVSGRQSNPQKTVTRNNTTIKTSQIRMHCIWEVSPLLLLYALRQHHLPDHRPNSNSLKGLGCWTEKNGSFHFVSIKQIRFLGKTIFQWDHCQSPRSTIDLVRSHSAQTIPQRIDPTSGGGIPDVKPARQMN